MVEDSALDIMVFLPCHDGVWAPAVKHKRRMYDVDSLSDRSGNKEDSPTVLVIEVFIAEE